ncbi:MAG: Trp family transcriptional regulator [Patescibacteria group bacterium]
MVTDDLTKRTIIGTVRSPPKKTQHRESIMSKRSSQPLEEMFEQQLNASLYQVFVDLSSRRESRLFCEGFFSKTELSIFAKRLAIGVLLDQGKSYEYIRKLLKVSSATISSIAETMQTKGYKLALQKLKVESWAEIWSNKLMRLFGGEIEDK